MEAALARDCGGSELWPCHGPSLSAWHETHSLQAGQIADPMQDGTARALIRTFPLASLAAWQLIGLELHSEASGTISERKFRSKELAGLSMSTTISRPGFLQLNSSTSRRYHTWDHAARAKTTARRRRRCLRSRFEIESNSGADMTTRAAVTIQRISMPRVACRSDMHRSIQVSPSKAASWGASEPPERTGNRGDDPNTGRQRQI